MADIGVSGDERRRSVRPLRNLFPYVTQYRKLAVGAIISLIVAAGTTLALPMAVRRMIDHGFQAAGTTFIAEY
ncbi:MAG: ABC transporter, partial [Mesorhizobium sp.]